MKIRSFTAIAIFAFVFASIGMTPAFAQSHADNGKLKIHVSPKQAYVFVDGNAIRDGNQIIKLSAGKHTIGVYNYGYAPKTQDVQIAANKTTDLQVLLQATGEKVSGPFADIELKGYPRAAVLLNGATPSYFVGHADEFDNNWLWPQRLLVRPGTYQITATQKGQTLWSGPVTAKAGQRVIVYLNRNGETKTRDWKEGNTLAPQARFHAGIASAEVPIAPVTAQLTASQTQSVCGQPAKLNWTSTDAADTSITNIGNVPASGDRTVTPSQSTIYQLIAKGPGGEAKQTVRVNIDTQPTATLTLSQPEVRYHKIGDKVVEQDSANLNWSTSNANKVTIEPLGVVAASGHQSFEAKPDQTSPGPIHQDVTYVLRAANACGGEVVESTTLHIAGSIDPPPAITLASLFYPTAYPEKSHPNVGLVSSQRQTLAKLSANFKNDQPYNQEAKLMIVGHADVRGPEKYNLELSERRADRVKAYLVSQGIAADKIQIRAEGKDQQLSDKEVEKLQSQDPQKPEKWMTRRTKATLLAYNRRVDVILEPAGQTSTEVYPNDAPDARVLWQRGVPSLKTVEAAEQMPGAEQNRTVAVNR